MSEPTHCTRRDALAVLALAGCSLRAAPAAADESFYPPVLPGEPLAFPRDHGAHPAFRTEWWYLTGWLLRLDGAQRGQPLGVQVTFFRSRTRHDAANPSRFAPTQLLLAHAALALPERGELMHSQRAARAGFGLASASTHDTALTIDGWSLQRDPTDRYRARIEDRRFALELDAEARLPPVPQGDAGFSRKGPLQRQASRYYSRPQLRTAGAIRIDGARMAVEGVAWLDHEWSSEILDAQAEGWDWTGLNLDDGSALVAFRIRRRDGGVAWSYARRIAAAGAASSGVATAGSDPAVRFVPLRHWSSPHSGARYPVAMRLELGARSITIEPLFDDQELDARASTGTIYWEGAVRAFEAGREIGRGYLELTGYAGALRL
ncbi:MAG TPA: lipocalin-like domain-containing protein [Burkholderiaceae bacterium]|nr:lipocalin-like domain-containing protein [Burkholderiaceae bacterium]